MKTTKAILFIALFAIASMGYSQSEIARKNMDIAPVDNLTVLIKLAHVSSVPGLTTVMREQLDISMIRDDQPNYTFPVKFRSTIYSITGSANEWRSFFSCVIHAPPER